MGIRSKLNELLESKMELGTIQATERFLITGKTELGGQSHSHNFVACKPYVYPLFKGHRLTEEQLDNKVIPPTRMVTGSVNGPTYRLGQFITHFTTDSGEVL